MDRFAPPLRPRWELDKRVPVALIITILGSAAAGIWTAAQLYENVAELDRRAGALERRQALAAELAQRVEGRLARIDAQLDILLQHNGIRIAPRGETPLEEPLPPPSGIRGQ